jgi:hypothetical protein
MNHCLHLIGSEGNFLTQTDENFNEKVNNEKSNFPRHHDSDLRARNGGPFTDGFSNGSGAGTSVWTPPSPDGGHGGLLRSTIAPDA